MSGGEEGGHWATERTRHNAGGRRARNEGWSRAGRPGRGERTKFPGGMRRGAGRATVTFALPAWVKLTWEALVQRAALAATGKVEGPRLDTGEGGRYLDPGRGEGGGGWSDARARGTF